MDLEHKMLPSPDGEISDFESKAKGKRISLYLLLTLALSLFLITFSLLETARDELHRMTDGRISGLGTALGEKAVLSFLAIESPAPMPNSPETDDPASPDNSIPDSPVDVEADTEYIPLETETPAPQSPTKYEHALVSKDLSQWDKGLYYISNDTGHKPNTEALASSPPAIPAFDFKSKQPLVLIIHTHGTESYSEEGAEGYNDTGNLWRTTDTEKNVVAVGAVVARVLEENGIPTLHCQVMHDKDSYNESYSYSAATIKKYLKQYPTIKYVFDIHRDAIISSDGTLIKGVTEIGGESVAQVMCVAGSDFKGADYPHWEANLALALKLREKLSEKSTTLCRPVYLRGAAYNLQYTNGGSLLLEIGSSGNTLSEAKRAAVLVAEELAEIIGGK